MRAKRGRLTGNQAANSNNHHCEGTHKNTASLPGMTALGEWADEAFRTGDPVCRGGLILAPDIWLLEGLSNGLTDIPATRILQRSDGRTVHVYTDPRGSGQR